MKTLKKVLLVAFLLSVGFLVLAYEDLRATKSTASTPIVLPYPVIVPIPAAIQPSVSWSTHPDTYLRPDESWEYSYLRNGNVTKRVHVYNLSYEWLEFYQRDLTIGEDCPQSAVFIYSYGHKRVYIGENAVQIQGSNWDKMLEAWDWVCGKALYGPSGYVYYQVEG